MANVGTTFKTGNATVATLKPGTKLEVLGNGTVKITETPTPVVGDTVTDYKGRTGKVVRLSTKYGFDPKKPLFVGSDNVVRNF